MGKCLICRPRIFTTEGADHTGQDAFLRCTRCRRRTINHIECERVTQTVSDVLRTEWRSGRTRPSNTSTEGQL